MPIAPKVTCAFTSPVHRPSLSTRHTPALFLASCLLDEFSTLGGGFPKLTPPSQPHVPKGRTVRVGLTEKDEGDRAAPFGSKPVTHPGV